MSRPDPLKSSPDAADEITRALIARVRELEEALSNIRGMAEQFDADPDLRAIADISSFALEPRVKT